MGRWNVRLLGQVRVTSPEGEAVRFRTRATEVVFAYLAHRAGDEVRRDTLAEIGWPSADEESARRSLRTALSSLRETFGGDCLEADRTIVRLRRDRFDVDVVRLREERDPSLYGGRFLEGYDAEWAYHAGLDAEEAFYAAAMDRMAALPTDEARRLAESILARDPSRLDVRARARELGLVATRGDGPLSATSFVGRERELAELAELLGDHRLITLTGPGGSGKSRLAAEVWRRRLPNAWFVPLADVRDSGAVAEAMRGSLRVPGSPDRGPVEQIAFALGDMAGLLVVDNFEQVVEAAGVLERLLRSCPSLRVLATSQVPLGLDEEFEYPIGPLDLAVLGADGLTDGQRLFLDRARTVSPGFAAREGDLPVVAKLCDRLDGYPLALEIAASKARVLSPGDMLTQLDDRFAFLTRVGESAGRQRSLRAAFDWSFERLPPVAQDALSEATVFRGGFTLASATAVLGIPCAAEAFELLAAHAWIDRAPGADPPRFRLLESVREYAAELLPPRRREALRRGHAHHYLRLARRCVETVFTAEEPLAHEAVDPEIPNLDAAWEWLIENDAEGALSFAVGLNWYWVLRGQWSLAQSRMDQALAVANPDPRPMLTYAYECNGNFVLFEGRFTDSEVWFRRAVAMAEQIGHTLYQGRALVQLAQAHAEQGRYEVAREEARRAVSLIEQSGNPNWIGAGLVVACLVANRMGDVQEARALGESAVRFCREGGYAWGVASALNELAMAHHLAGDYGASLRYQEEAIVIKRRTNTPRSLALSLGDLAATRLELGDADGALAALREGTRILASLGSPGAFPRVYLTAAKAFARVGDLPASAACASAARFLIGDGPRHAHLGPDLPEAFDETIGPGALAVALELIAGDERGLRDAVTVV
ncbi:MAG: tetratricopeptide repeat protein [Fimbriimonadaceae bacterium]|nr:tetratricopeptide repeat protein [Fimbriimonadaceae bacterium]